MTPADPAAGDIVIEAETGAFESPFMVVNIEGGQALTSNDFSPGISTYDVVVPEDGFYKFGLRVLAPDVSSDSVYFSVNGEANIKYATGIHTELTDIMYQGASVYQLSKGVHKLVLTNREKITIDKIYFRAQ